ncbi:Signal transduction histidine kinase [Nocardiopsis flavescens]|uniref:histidine kinase n=1 Tax=Nocardiopsis flavescens TaxID=758803 RepID=A0A1M6SS09_9ACTN|nr:histidine kinase [Nocardiopsis flavescens]SHK47503.1 Signal transduction histidine kinase [Nocardiopsis flavescens]
MWTWVKESGRALGSLGRRNGRWWWERRLDFADWFYALGPLPFSGMLQISAGASAGVGLLGPVPVLGVSAMASVNAFAAVLAAFVIYAAPALWAAAVVLLRRTDPRWLLATALVLLLLFGNFVPAAVALYSYAVYFSDRRVLTAWLVALSLGMAAAYDMPFLGHFFLIIGFLITPTVMGLWVGTRRQLIDRLHERAERLEREQHLLADNAITAERTRIAREMHDVVAHRVSLMVLHAGGLEVSSEDSRTIETAGLIRTTGREALAELRGILGVLREEGEAAPTAPQPVLSDLDRLVREWRTAGMEIERTDTGGAGPVPGPVQRTVYRIVQEGLTNAAKHAQGARVSVLLHHAPGRLEVEVANGPAPAPAGAAAPAPAPRSGFGLTGLRERVVLAGGDLSAGVCPDGGWRLRARVPTDTPAGDEEAAP